MNHNFYVISQLLRGSWLIEPEFAQSQLPLIRAYLEGKIIEAEDRNGAIKKEIPAEKTACFAISALDGERNFHRNLEEAPEGSLAVVKLLGAVMKEDFCGALGTATIKNYLEKADRSPNISGALLWIDSPGGTADGTQDLALTVQNFTKPLISFIDGLAASAAYWIASPANKIIANNETALIGSIGTMITLRDYRAIQEAAGVKEHIIYADKSTDKNRTYLEALDNNYKPIKEELLNPLNEIFLNTIKANRPGVKEKALTGKVFLSENALKMGLIDAIGNFSFALSELEKLTKKSSNQIKNNMSLKDWFSGGSASATKIEIEAAELNQLRADMQEAQAQIENLTAQTTELSAQNGTLSAELKEARAQIESLTAERDKFKQEAEAYGAQPGEMHSQPEKPAGDNLPEEDPAKKIIEELPHSQELKDNPYFN